MKVKVSFVLICYNEKDEVLNCIKSIKRLKTKHSYEIFLCDNASTDETLEEVKNQFKDVNIIALPKNIGTPPPLGVG